MRPRLTRWARRLGRCFVLRLQLAHAHIEALRLAAAVRTFAGACDLADLLRMASLTADLLATQQRIRRLQWELGALS